MDIKKINELIAESKWTAMLNELTAGTHIIEFPSVDAIKSCKAVAYSINSDGIGRTYTFNVNKSEKTAVINVKEDE